MFLGSTVQGAIFLERLVHVCWTAAFLGLTGRFQRGNTVFISFFVHEVLGNVQLKQYVKRRGESGHTAAGFGFANLLLRLCWIATCPFWKAVYDLLSIAPEAVKFTAAKTTVGVAPWWTKQCSV